MALRLPEIGQGLLRHEDRSHQVHVDGLRHVCIVDQRHDEDETKQPARVE
jgi:hypothetical protein